MENDERAEAIKAGQARARAAGKHIVRSRRIFDRTQVVTMRDRDGLSWPEIARRTGAGMGTARRAYDALQPRPGLAKTIEERIA